MQILHVIICLVRCYKIVSIAYVVMYLDKEQSSNPTIRYVQGQGAKPEL